MNVDSSVIYDNLAHGYVRRIPKDSLKINPICPKCEVLKLEIKKLKKMIKELK